MNNILKKELDCTCKDFIAEVYGKKSKTFTYDERTTIAMDFSDISKEFGGNGMEGMEMGWDGSRGCTAMGHDFICASLASQFIWLLGDNVETLAFKTHSLLCAIRDLYTEAKVRFISGRPHKKGLESSFQMVFKLE